MVRNYELIYCGIKETKAAYKLSRNGSCLFEESSKLV